MTNEEQITDANTALDLSSIGMVKRERRVQTSDANKSSAVSLPMLISSHEPDIINSRFVILPNQPLPDFDSRIAKAYAVENKRTTDKKKYYALIFEPTYPTRLHVIKLLQEEVINYFNRPVEYEIVQLSSTNSWHLVVVLEQPKGVTLRQILKKNGALNETLVMEKILAPLCKFVTNMHHFGSYCHGSLNIDTLFFDEDQNLIVGECVSDLCGANQPAAFEPLERALVAGIARGEGEPSVDMYAIGIIAIACTNIKFFSTYLSLDDKTLIKNRLAHSSFLAVVDTITLPSTIRELARGLLADNPLERWNYRQLADWLKGKKLGMSSNANFAVASRSIIFNEHSYTNVRSLAYELYHNWDTATKFLTDTKLIRWIERSLNAHEMAEHLGVQAQMLTHGHGALSLTEDNFVMHCLLILYPEGPLFYKALAVNWYGLGPTLVHAVNQNDMDTISDVYAIIISNLNDLTQTHQWRANIHAVEGSGRLFWDNLKMFATYNAPGFGLERCMYELNPSLPCQSPALQKYYVTNLESLLVTLNELAGTPDFGIIDRHIAAFMMHKMDLHKPIKVSGLMGFPDFENNKAIRTLTLVVAAEKEVKIKNLNKLAKELANELTSFVNLYKSKTLRKKQQEILFKMAEEGKMSSMLQLLTEYRTIKRDLENFMQAARRYYVLQKQVDLASDTRRLYELGYTQGLRFSLMLAFSVCGIVMAYIVSGYFH